MHCAMKEEAYTSRVILHQFLCLMTYHLTKTTIIPMVFPLGYNIKTNKRDIFLLCDKDNTNKITK